MRLARPAREGIPAPTSNQTGGRVTRPGANVMSAPGNGLRLSFYGVICSVNGIFLSIYSIFKVRNLG
jgi:hypothetical protein